MLHEQGIIPNSANSVLPPKKMDYSKIEFAVAHFHQVSISPQGSLNKKEVGHEV